MLPECFFCEVLRGRTASQPGRSADRGAAQRPRMVRFLGSRPSVRALLALGGRAVLYPHAELLGRQMRRVAKEDARSAVE
jgi:hypothetical protein